MKIADFITDKKYCLLVVFIFFFSNQFAFGQKNLKYKDVFKTVEEKSKEEAYSVLLVYQKQDPFFANTYLQLGMISQFWSKDYDPLTNIKDVEFFIYNTNLYYGLALSKIDQKEVRKNIKYYLNIDRFKGREEVEFEEVRSYIQEQMDANTEYSKNVQIVTRLFNLSIKHYNNCVRIFKEINSNNNKIKDIYLTASARFLENLNELESSFDSTIYYLQNYQTAIKSYPIKSYNQKYKLLPIETYRLHGLTGSDFLNDEIPIWNYGVWVKNIKQVLNTEIADMRNQINIADQKLNENISMLTEAREYKPDFTRLKVDEKLKYKIGKYDYQSILLKLFNFKESKINFIADLRNPVNNPKDTLTKFSLLEKARFYESVLNSKKKCDSLNKDISSSLNVYEINKYNDFVNSKYGGDAGLKNYLKNELSFLSSQLKNSHNHFKEYLIHSFATKRSLFDSIRYKNMPFTFVGNVANFANASPNVCNVTNYMSNSNGEVYLTGFLKEGNNPFHLFLAKINSKAEIIWLKVVPSGANNSCGLFVEAKDDGCDVLLISSNDAAIQNLILTFDPDGKQKERFDLGINAIPRYFKYDEINQKYLVLFKGIKADQIECLDDELLVLQFDPILKKEIWKQSLKVKGVFNDVLTMNQNIFIVNSFTEYQSDLGYTSSGAGKSTKSTNAIIFVVDQNGNLSKEIPILDDKPFFITNVVKINSNTLNLLGFKSEFSETKNASIGDLGELVYLLLDANGNVFYENIKN
jgi:hypothetical protein